MNMPLHSLIRLTKNQEGISMRAFWIYAKFVPSSYPNYAILLDLRFEASFRFPKSLRNLLLRIRVWAWGIKLPFNCFTSNELRSNQRNPSKSTTMIRGTSPLKHPADVMHGTLCQSLFPFHLRLTIPLTRFYHY